MSGFFGEPNSDLTQPEQETLATFSYAFTDMNRNKNDFFDLKSNFINAIIYQKIHAERYLVNQDYKNKLKEQVNNNTIDNQTAKSKIGATELQNYNLTKAIIEATKLSKDAVAGLSIKQIFELQKIDHQSASNYISQAVTDIANDYNVNEDNIREQIKFLTELKQYVDISDKMLVNLISNITDSKTKVIEILADNTTEAIKSKIASFLMYPEVVNSLHRSIDQNSDNRNFILQVIENIKSTSDKQDYAQSASLLGLTHHIAQLEIAKNDSDLKTKINDIYSKIVSKKTPRNLNKLTQDEKQSQLFSRENEVASSNKTKDELSTSNHGYGSSQNQKDKTIESITNIITKYYIEDKNNLMKDILTKLITIVEQNIDDKFALQRITEIEKGMPPRIPSAQGIGLTYGSSNLSKNIEELSSDTKNSKIYDLDTYVNVDDFKNDLSSDHNIIKWKQAIEKLTPGEDDTPEQIQYKLNKLNETSQVLFQTLRFNKEQQNTYLNSDQIIKITDLQKSISETFNKHKRLSNNNASIAYDETLKKILMIEAETPVNNTSNKLR